MKPPATAASQAIAAVQVPEELQAPQALAAAQQEPNLPVPVPALLAKAALLRAQEQQARRWQELLRLVL